MWHALFKVSTSLSHQDIPHQTQHRYLLKQGYNKEGDLVILTPYVGQLRLLKAAVSASNIRVVIDEKDIDQLAHLEDKEVATAAVLPKGAARGSAVHGGGAVSLQRSASSSSSSGNSGPAGSAGSAAAAGAGTSDVKVVEMSSCLRLATIDNFQVSKTNTCNKIRDIAIS